MTRVAREFENILLNVRSTISTLRPASYELLDTLIEKTKRCFADQKRTHQLGLRYQIGGPAAGFLLPVLFAGVAALAGNQVRSFVTSPNMKKNLDDFLRYDALQKISTAFSWGSTGFQWGSKGSEILKSRNDAEGYDHQASQKQIDSMSSELASTIQAQTVALQALETAMQKHEQILAKGKQ